MVCHRLKMDLTRSVLENSSAAPLKWEGCHDCPVWDRLSLSVGFSASQLGSYAEETHAEVVQHAEPST